MKAVHFLGTSGIDNSATLRNNPENSNPRWPSCWQSKWKAAALVQYAVFAFCFPAPLNGDIAVCQGSPQDSAKPCSEPVCYGSAQLEGRSARLFRSQKNNVLYLIKWCRIQSNDSKTLIFVCWKQRRLLSTPPPPPSFAPALSVSLIFSVVFLQLFTSRIPHFSFFIYFFIPFSFLPTFFFP